MPPFLAFSRSCSWAIWEFRSALAIGRSAEGLRLPSLWAQATLPQTAARPMAATNRHEQVMYTSLLFERVGLLHRNRHAVLWWCGERGEKRQNVRKFLFLQQHTQGRHGRNRQVLKPLGEFGVGVHEAFNDV